MIDRARLSAFLLGLAGAWVLLGATAAADDGATGACTTRDGKPSCTILRPPASPGRVPPPDAPECIVAVGGLGSSNDDGTFDRLLGQFRDDSRYVIHRFGSTTEDPARFSYDTYGSIDRSARALRDYVRSLSGSCRRIHIVAHSMGGDVADRAFSLGLSGDDGVVTYLPISTPHNGAMVARFIAKYVDSDEYFAEAASELARDLHVHDPTSPAVRDLARIRPPRPPREVVELRQRLASDEFVFLPDNWDWRYELRDRLPDPYLGELAGIGTNIGAGGLGTAAGQVLRSATEFEGHGGSLLNAKIRETAAFVIRNVLIPPDDRDWLDKVLIFAMNVALVVIALCVGKYIGTILSRAILLSKWLTRPLAALLPHLAEWLPAFSKIASTVVALAKGTVTAIKTVVDAFGEIFDDAGDLIPRHVTDPRVAMVRSVLDRASQLLSRQ